MGHVQDPPVSTNMISIVCMIYHMKVHMFGYDLGPPKMPKSKIHILTISEPISMKPAIVRLVGRPQIYGLSSQLIFHVTSLIIYKDYKGRIVPNKQYEI